MNFSGSCQVVCFSPCGRLLVTVATSDVRNLAVWDVATGRTLGELRGHTKAILKARFTDSGQLVSWGTDGTIRTWDLRRGTVLGVAALSIPAAAG